MAIEARELEAFFQAQQNGELAKMAGDLAIAAEAAGFQSTKKAPKIEVVEGKFTSETLKIGGKSKAELLRDLNQPPFRVSDYAQDLINSPKFVVTDEHDIEVVRLSVAELGFNRTSTTRQIFERAQEKGLNLCPPEVGPYQRLQDKDQPLGDWYWIAMDTIADRYGDPLVFALSRNGDELWLDGRWTDPDSGWHPGDRLVFSLSK